MNKTTDNLYDGEDEMLESALADTNESEAAMFSKPTDNLQRCLKAEQNDHQRCVNRLLKAEAQRDAAVAALRQAQSALAHVSGNARTDRVINAYCRVTNAIAAAEKGQ